MIISTQNIENVRKEILKAKKENVSPIIIQARSNEFNRKILESGKFDILLSIEFGDKKDNLREIDSGLNHVLAEIASKNNVSIGIDLEKIKNLDKKQKAKILNKVKQNIFLCKKSKTNIKVINSKDKIDSFNFLISLGADTKQSKQAIDF